MDASPLALGEVMDLLEVGVCVWQLETVGQRESLRLRVCNPAAARFLSVRVEDVVGKQISEGFPGSLDTPLPGVFTNVIETQTTVALGDVPYKDEIVPDGMFSIVVRPVGKRSALVEFTNVTEERRAQAEAKATLAAAAEARDKAERFAQSAKDLDEKLRVIEAQKRDIIALTAPILEVGTGVLAMPLAGNFDLQRSEIVREKLLDVVSSTKARDVVIDVTGLGSIDELTANELVRLTSSLALLGARAYLTGISPANAQTMVSSNARIPAGMCMRSLKSALQLLGEGGRSGITARGSRSR
ncbi:RsbR, positive regulator of sigma-B [Enhygromyxa salina]|uniref:RsbR, positive regulator of sigma-B n=1 Tax=Enhygromyxa salina TaxID=215803 RepID=A0A0C2A752_9BACT|nr:STAS domain-containing protein [Enhygromyxa salina]KIG19233.1 RsbR, positive regulator of sigma-B [Enhygromyxa salina]